MSDLGWGGQSNGMAASAANAIGGLEDREGGLAANTLSSQTVRVGGVDATPIAIPIGNPKPTYASNDSVRNDVRHLLA